MKNPKEYLHLVSEYVLKQHKIDENTPHDLVEVDAIDLLVPERIDIAAKLAFIKAYETGKDIPAAEELYKHHIDAFTDGLFTEYGSREKNSYEKFRQSFLNLIDSIKENGFNSDVSLVPVGADNVAIGGAHRIACAIYFNKRIKVVKFNHVKTVFDYEYFRSHLLKEKYIISMVKEFIEYKPDSYVAFIWPKGYEMKKLIIDSFKKNQVKIVYRKNSQLDYKTYWNLVFSVYKNEDWVGTPKDEHIGVTRKALFTYEKHGKMVFLVINGISLEKAAEIKNELRKQIGQKKRSMHMTDTKEEALEMIPLILNAENSSNERLKENVHLIKKKLRFLYTHSLILLKKKLGYPV